MSFFERICRPKTKEERKTATKNTPSSPCSCQNDDSENEDFMKYQQEWNCKSKPVDNNDCESYRNISKNHTDLSSSGSHRTTDRCSVAASDDIFGKMFTVTSGYRNCVQNSCCKLRKAYYGEKLNQSRCHRSVYEGKSPELRPISHRKTCSHYYQNKGAEDAKQFRNLHLNCKSNLSKLSVSDGASINKSESNISPCVIETDTIEKLCSTKSICSRMQFMEKIGRRKLCHSNIKPRDVHNDLYQWHWRRQDELYANKLQCKDDVDGFVVIEKGEPEILDTLITKSTNECPKILDKQVRLIVCQEHRRHQLLFDSKAASNQSQPSDIKELQEMAFGSIAVTYKSETWKVHKTIYPSQIILTNVWILPKNNECLNYPVRDSVRIALSEGTNDYKVKKEGNAACSVPIEVPSSSTRMLVDKENGMEYKVEGFCNSDVGMFEFNRKRMPDILCRKSESSRTNVLQEGKPVKGAKIAVILVFTLDSEQLDHFSSFFFSQFLLVKHRVSLFARDLRESCSTPEEFSKMTTKGFRECTRQILDLYQFPRMLSPLWQYRGGVSHCRNSCPIVSGHQTSVEHDEKFPASIASKIIHGEGKLMSKKSAIVDAFLAPACDGILLQTVAEQLHIAPNAGKCMERRQCGLQLRQGRVLSLLCKWIGKHDSRHDQCFLSSLLTAVLARHLGWVAAMSLSNLSSHPPNAFVAQLSDLHGAIGYPLCISRTVVVGNDAESMQELVELLSYFIRYSQIEEFMLDKHSFEEIFDASKVSEALGDEDMKDKAQTSGHDVDSGIGAMEQIEVHCANETSANTEELMIDCNDQNSQSNSQQVRNTPDSLQDSLLDHITVDVGKEGIATVNEQISPCLEACFFDKILSVDVPMSNVQCGSSGKMSHLSQSQNNLLPVSCPEVLSHGNAGALCTPIQSDVYDGFESMSTNTATCQNLSTVSTCPSEYNSQEPFSEHIPDPFPVVSCSQVGAPSLGIYPSLVGAASDFSTTTSAPMLQPLPTASLLPVTYPSLANLKTENVGIIPSLNNNKKINPKMDRSCQSVTITSNNLMCDRVQPARQNTSLYPHLSPQSHGLYPSIELASQQVLYPELIHMSAGIKEKTLVLSDRVGCPTLPMLSSSSMSSAPISASITSASVLPTCDKDSVRPSIGFPSSLLPANQPSALSLPLSPSYAPMSALETTIDRIGADKDSMGADKIMISRAGPQENVSIVKECTATPELEPVREQVRNVGRAHQVEKIPLHQWGKESKCSSYNGDGFRLSSLNCQLQQKKGNGEEGAGSHPDEPQDCQIQSQSMLYLPLLLDQESSVYKSKPDNVPIAGVSDHFLSDFVLHATTDQDFQEKLAQDLRDSFKDSIFEATVAESVAIVADTNAFEVHINSCQHTSADHISRIKCVYAPLVNNMLFSIFEMHKMGVSSQMCLEFLEDQLHGFYQKTQVIAAYIQQTQGISKEHLRRMLRVDGEDMTFLLSIAGVHSQHFSMGL